MTSPDDSFLLSIHQLHAGIEDKSILKGIQLQIKPGEVHAIMGPNGSGKSTLSSVLAGHPQYTVTQGEVRFNGKDLLEMEPEVRAREGLFLAFQYPVELPGVSMTNFMKTALQEHYRHQQREPLNAKDFLAEVSNLEKDFTKSVFDKYGKVNIDPRTGEITKLD
mgnify:CR=1 FL=1